MPPRQGNYVIKKAGVNVQNDGPTVVFNFTPERRLIDNIKHMRMRTLKAFEREMAEMGEDLTTFMRDFFEESGNYWTPQSSAFSPVARGSRITKRDVHPNRLAYIHTPPRYPDKKNAHIAMGGRASISGLDVVAFSMGYGAGSINLSGKNSFEYGYSLEEEFGFMADVAEEFGENIKTRAGRAIMSALAGGHTAGAEASRAR